MRILDRYVLRSFLMNYLISLFVLIGMYIVLDMVFNFDELVEPRGGVHLTTIQLIIGIAGYYFHQSFLIFTHLSGIIPVVAAAFTLIRLSRFNELSAILASGVHLLRVAMPIILAGIVLQGLLIVDQELIIPNMISKLQPWRDQLMQQATGRAYPIQAMQDDRNGVLFAGRYVPPTNSQTAVMYEMDVVERNDDFLPIGHIVAERAEWDAKNQQWDLAKGRLVTGLLPDEKYTPEKAIVAYKSNITPEEVSLFHSGEFVQLLSRARINELLDPQRKQLYGAMDLLRVKHFRLSQPIMNFLMLLISIPCVLTREPGKLKSLIFKCLVLVGLCMASYFIAYQIAGFPPAGAEWVDRWPALLAAAPIIVFGPIAVFLLDRLPT